MLFRLTYTTITNFSYKNVCFEIQFHRPRTKGQETHASPSSHLQATLLAGGPLNRQLVSHFFSGMFAYMPTRAVLDSQEDTRTSERSSRDDTVRIGK